MRMNDFDGKEFLAAVRGKDYAHAGEEESINLVFGNIPKKAERRILDAGCGRGGTADFVQKQGWGHVVGVDIEAQSIDYAKVQYPESEFIVCDINDVGLKFPDAFEIIYSFNAFYAFEDKLAALKSLRKSARAGARLFVFDYTWCKPEIELPEVMLSQKPSTLEEFSVLLREANWELSRNQNLDQKYIEWYRDFLSRFDTLAETHKYSGERLDSVRKKYSDLLFSLEEGIMGGVLIVAYAN